SGIDGDLWLIVHQCDKEKGQIGESPVGFLVVYVDDFLAIASTIVLDALMSTVKSTWELGALRVVRSGSGESVQFLGLNICMEKKGSIWISQRQFALDLLEKWNLKDANPSKTPGVTDDWKGPPPAETVAPKESEKELLKGTQQMVGSLLWLSGRTRPDLSYPVSRLASFLGKDLSRAFGGCKKALRYLRGTLDWGLRYETSSSGSGCPQLEAFGDASFGAEDLQAQQGVIVFWGGCPVIWRSCRQTLASSSTAEAELQAVHLTSLILEGTMSMACELLGKSVQSSAFAPVIRSDNTAAICLATEPPQHWRTRHLALRAKVVQERLKSGSFVLKHVPSSEQRADSLTKPFTGPMMEKSRRDLGVCECRMSRENVEIRAVRVLNSTHPQFPVLSSLAAMASSSGGRPAPDDGQQQPGPSRLAPLRANQLPRHERVDAEGYQLTRSGNRIYPDGRIEVQSKWDRMSNRANMRAQAFQYRESVLKEQGMWTDEQPEPKPKAQATPENVEKRMEKSKDRWRYREGQIVWGVRGQTPWQPQLMRADLQWGDFGPPRAWREEWKDPMTWQDRWKEWKNWGDRDPPQENPDRENQKPKQLPSRKDLHLK
ncbi:MAG: transposon Pol polyprotein, partial [Rickettsiaceae bacterium]